MKSIAVLIGHGKSSKGGYDPGAVSGKYQEFKIAKEIGKYTKSYILKDYDIHCDLINYDGELNLRERIAYVNKKDYDFVVEIHLNAGGGRGCEVYHSKSNSFGKKVAGLISKTVAKDLQIPDRGAKIKLGSTSRDYFGIIRETDMTALLIETVFIDTKSDLDLVKSSSGMKKIAKSIAKAIGEGCSLEKKAAPTTSSPIFKKGDSSLGVYAYKQMLVLAKDKGIITSGVDDNGIFGEGTGKATVEVQKYAKLAENGMVDKQTIKALRKAIQK